MPMAAPARKSANSSTSAASYIIRATDGKSSPARARPEPPTLEALKAELGRRWPMTGLLDILEETVTALLQAEACGPPGCRRG